VIQSKRVTASVFVSSLMNFLCAGIFVQLHSEISVVTMNFPFNSSQISCPFVTMLTSKLASVLHDSAWRHIVVSCHGRCRQEASLSSNLLTANCLFQVDRYLLRSRHVAHGQTATHSVPVSQPTQVHVLGRSFCAENIYVQKMQQTVSL